MFSKILVLVVLCCVLLMRSDGMKTQKDGNDQVSSRIMYPNDFLLLGDQHHHHHHHSPDYHYRRREYIEPDYDSNTEEVNENGSVQGTESKYSYNKDIPLDFIQNINKHNVSDLLLNFIEDDVEYDQPVLLNRFADTDDNGARNSAKLAKPAGCAPEMTTVQLATSDDPSQLYIPQCTKIERCGGCCSHNLLSCQPKETETFTYQVLKTQYTGGQKLKLLSKEIILVERHTKCKCDCKVKEEHCNKYQEYRPSECRCTCSNLDEEKKCIKDESKKLWNSELCACQCKDVVACTTGYYFNQIECRCVAEPKKHSIANFGRQDFVTEALTVSPIADDF